MKDLIKKFWFTFGFTLLAAFILALAVGPLVASITLWLLFGSRLWWLLMLCYLIIIPLLISVGWWIHDKNL